MAHRWWTPAAAAVAVVLIGAGAAGWFGRGDDPRAAGAAPPARGSQAIAVPPGDPADLLVRDGDPVAVSGRVVAVPGRPVRMCAPAAQAAPAPGHPGGREPTGEPVPAYCDLGVTVRGLDLARVADRRVTRGVVTGQVRVEGTYRDGVVAVERQAPPDTRPEPYPRIPERPPCPAPAGGWEPATPDVEGLVRWLRANQDRYVEPYVTYPDGPPPLRDDGGATPVPPATVTVVGTVLDPAVAERELRAVYRGNLCVVPARHPGATLTAVTDRATDEPAWSAHGVFAADPDSVTGTVTVRLVVVDPAVQRWLQQVDDRTGTVAAHPWVRPLRPR